jgi:hypothetical protein
MDYVFIVLSPPIRLKTWLINVGSSFHFEIEVVTTHKKKFLHFDSKILEENLEM